MATTKGCLVASTNRGSLKTQSTSIPSLSFSTNAMEGRISFLHLLPHNTHFVDSVAFVVVAVIVAEAVAEAVAAAAVMVAVAVIAEGLGGEEGEKGKRYCELKDWDLN
ncbi:uncharacterized protein LOC110268816 [Arachis ipaensis]|uniref:uncharacterized protein LOC110268816 n=1 Tax=Arachis ipaensis TaxID=130454 RepID=UPI000A2B6327|nr:uncharacterized protein LOC110268816 [Arachis ipaensis]QHO23714.1 uncharacterized protein DS421_12g365930 [Arachis hypogaea]